MKQSFKLLTCIFVIASFIVTLNVNCKRKGCTNPGALNYDPKAKKDDGSCEQLAIGKEYQGGTIFYVLLATDPGYKAGEVHGLIAAKSDQSSGITWYNGSTGFTYAIATGLGQGSANTVSIMNYQGNGNYAAKKCGDLAVEGYSDWFLPSKDELNLLYQNRASATGLSGNYWSSTEVSAAGAWGQDFNTGNQLNFDKSQMWKVRAIRAF